MTTSQQQATDGFHGRGGGRNRQINKERQEEGKREAWREGGRNIKKWK